MSQDNLERFREVVLRNGELRRRLSEPTRQEAFVALMVELGRQNGCELTAAEVEAALQTARRAWYERWF